MTPEMNDNTVIDESFDPVAYIESPDWIDSRLGLDRIEALLERLGRPQDKLHFVHVAGTNGKGSTCAYLESILRASGYRTGLFTSPSIECFEDRVRVNNVNMSHADLVEITLEVRDAAEQLAVETNDHATEFELLWAVAVMHFARQNCDIVVTEVGLGGRWDATNMIEDPEVCVIARIGLDHTDLLGDTVGAIAAEKAGIIKPNSAVVSYPQEPEALLSIIEACEKTSSTLDVIDTGRVTPGRITWDGPNGAPQRKFMIETVEGPLCFATKMLGSYQAYNALLSIEAARALWKKGWGRITDATLREGIESTVWAGRFEVVSTKPIFIIDGGHNPQGAEALASSLADVVRKGQKVTFVMGVLADKDFPDMIGPVLPYAQAFVTITPPNVRALSAQDLATAIQEAAQGTDYSPAVEAAFDFETAFVRAKAITPDDGIICAFGSLYSIASIRAAASSILC